MEPMYIAGEKWMIILSSVDFKKLFHVIKYFLELNNDFEQEYTTFPLSSYSISIEWRNKHLFELK